ncbi:phosphatidylserine decarboxylase [Actinosynnema sp. NPDC047251]|uniref:Phosphatidylserine decarboxylase proenzyme n=1 Tax=Saccharothrix espanaensis (strain ATCC 51144 / DSM 44229 / JCM 9112 / NBRC 15066 / NRRL 15764) TaxID=1179773 RepID=K0JNU6_SACES|nr:phosphatidylserine decarboxylase [Saccharothrix espanaensis]CCH27800.1 Phosphatidylserine decarboxylase proenzyme [Saccharothrix espanaensis DSM 44229]
MTVDRDKNSGAVSHFIDLARGIVPPMHPAGRPFVAGAAVATLLVRRFSRRAGVVGALLTAWVAWFFREPVRTTPTRPNLAVAPADGTVSHVVDAVPPAELGLGDVPMTRISVFLSVFDVHVQRLPVSGAVRQVSYRPGKFLSADLDKASEDNERNTVWLTSTEGHDVVVVQIAGLVARRIVCHVADGDKVEVGRTYGLIRFGSRVDLYVPQGSRVLVEAGQRTIGGETVLAELPEL